MTKILSSRYTPRGKFINDHDKDLSLVMIHIRGKKYRESMRWKMFIIFHVEKKSLDDVKMRVEMF